MNQRSVHLHVIADAATSVLAIMALVSGMYLGAAWLDPVVGWVGAGLVAVWAWGLIRDSGQVLLDAQMDAPIVEEIREAIEESGIPVRIGDPEIFRSALAVHDEIVRVTIEVGEIGVGQSGKSELASDRRSRMGHTASGTTEDYAKFDGDQVREAWMTDLAEDAPALREASAGQSVRK